MKKTLFILSVALFSISCNDDDIAPANQTNSALVTRISDNGITAIELFYDLEKRLYRLNYYAQGKLASYILYDYGDDGLKELKRFEANHTLDYRSVFTLDNLGRVIKGENYSTPDSFDEVTSFNEFEYNASRQLTAREYSADGYGPSVYYRDENSYDSDGNLIRQQRTYYPNQDEEYTGRLYEYTPDSKSIPESWVDYLFILELTNHDDYITNMFISNVNYKHWGSANTLSSQLNSEMSGQEHDEDGNLIRQLITRKNILHPQFDFVEDMTYDYKKEN